jgi:hypothetical protein
LGGPAASGPPTAVGAPEPAAGPGSRSDERDAFGNSVAPPSYAPPTAAPEPSAPGSWAPPVAPEPQRPPSPEQ